MDQYEAIIKKIWKKEREKLRKKILESGTPKWLEIKIENHIKRTNISLNEAQEIKNAIKAGNQPWLSVFMKDPKKQNVYEQIFIKEVTGAGFNISKLPAVGKQALYVFNDGIIKNINKPLEIKSLDFYIKHPKMDIYVVHKYTNENGGAQDNQYHDVINQLKELGEKTENIVWFCLDGKYYNDQKINDLKAIRPNSKIFNINSLILELKKL